MDHFLFWFDWQTKYRVFYHILMGIFAVLVLLLVFVMVMGVDIALSWQVINQLDPLPVRIHSFNFGLLDFPLTADSYVISQRFAGSEYQISLFWYYFLLIVIAGSIICSLSVITTLKGFWYYLGMAAFILLAIGLNLEHLMLFGNADNTGLIFTYAIFIPLSFYFNAFNRTSSLFIRMAAFTVATVLWGVIIFLYAKTETPFLHLASYGLGVPIVISLVFIFMIANEIIVSFLFITTNFNTLQSRNSMFHFFVLSLIYLGNVLLTYLHNRGKIAWDFYYLNEFFILIVCALLGIWGFRHKRVMYKNILPFAPMGAYLYLFTGMVCMATLIFTFASANDPMIETFEDAIIFAQLGFGIMLLVYILGNFFTLLYHNQPVYKVVFKPHRIPYFTTQLGGYVFVLGLFLLSNKTPLNQAIAGYNNILGDLHLRQDDRFLAKQYYLNASNYGYLNHRSNYTLAILAGERKDINDAFYYLGQSIRKHPTPFGYINLSNLYLQKDRFFDALFTLRQGMREFPDNAVIANNLGLLYNRTEVVDSSFFYLEKAMHNNFTKTKAEANWLASLAKSNFIVNQDSLDLLYLNSPSKAVAANLLALKVNALHQVDFKTYESGLDDSVLTPTSFPYWYNLGLASIADFDTLQISLLKKLRMTEANYWCAERLKFVESLQWYFKGNVGEALMQLNEMQIANAEKSGYYTEILGLIALHHRAFRKSQDYFERSYYSGNVSSLLPGTVSLLATGKMDSVGEIQEKFPEIPHDSILTYTMHQLVQNKNPTLDSLKDADLFQWLKFKLGEIDSASWVAVAGKIDDDNYRAMAWYEFIMHEILTGDQVDLSFFQRVIESIEISNSEVFDNYERLRALVQLLHSDSTAGIEEKEMIEDTPELPLRKLYNATQTKLENDTGNALESYRRLAFENPFFVPGVLQAANCLNDLDRVEDAYEVLLYALKIDPYSIPVRKKYILQSLRLGLNGFAESALEILRQQIDGEAFNEFEKEYRNKEKIYESEGWI